MCAYIVHIIIILAMQCAARAIFSEVNETNVIVYKFHNVVFSREYYGVY